MISCQSGCQRVFREERENVCYCESLRPTNITRRAFPRRLWESYVWYGMFLGCRKKILALSGIYTTAVGYAAGTTANPTYPEVCTGRTGHNEVVLVVYKSNLIEYETLLKIFWENHDPTQGMRQGNDIGTQYRSGIYTFDEKQSELAFTSRHQYQNVLSSSGYGEITSEILPAPEFYYAEEYHQQYLAKNPSGYCGLGGTGVEYPQLVLS